jgi:hypothetical protein
MAVETRWAFVSDEALCEAALHEEDGALDALLDRANDQRIDWVQAQLEEQRVPMMDATDVEQRSRIDASSVGFFGFADAWHAGGDPAAVSAARAARLEAAMLDDEQPVMDGADLRWRTRPASVLAARDRVIEHIIEEGSRLGPLTARMTCYRAFVHDWPFIDLFMSAPHPTYGTEGAR